MADETIWTTNDPGTINPDSVPEDYRDLLEPLVQTVAAKLGVTVGKKAKPKPVKAKKKAVAEELDHSKLEFTPSQLLSVLRLLVEAEVKTSFMMWGPPGIGKSSLVAAVCRENDLQLVDLRLSQLAPTDLRGVPVVRKIEDGTEVTVFMPPSFMPRSGRGVLFLDEINLAPPVMMGMAQQLLLDRKVGDYTLPDGWFVWAAGNRREDKAAVSAMPSPVANRMIHVDLIPDGEDWAAYAGRAGLDPLFSAYVMSNFKRGAGSGDNRDWSPLLVMPKDGSMRFPSPRSWEVAAKLFSVGLPLATAIGQAEARQFGVFAAKHKDLMDSLKAGKPVTINSGDAVVVAWMAELVGYKKTIKTTGNQAEFDQLRAEVRELLS